MPRPSSSPTDNVSSLPTRIPPELQVKSSAQRWIASGGMMLWFAALLLILVVSAGSVLGG